ncbi:hypothetical protein H310_02230 [Aphanomyces invadans]|uniref:3-dehydrosphinganine reductase n=1 Tax=Aphanomyces invadans TaxID=157072 RepID=A0A024UMX4_9STRA|nr:hypothetical protein H310_02230 [Aphanomyces invadans]ETW07801.1 hypothetical protein H310_02230 [Aphanomyces invadans]|eukprot:XP_008863894.1 hypothetical protein H310_02230 [Aphanomyces invadans]
MSADTAYLVAFIVLAVPLGATVALTIISAVPPRRPLDFRGKHVLVTGGSEGLGRAIALQLVASGADVTIVARRAEVLQRVVDEVATLNSPYHGHIFYQVADVTDVDAIESAIARAHEVVGPIDILFPNAGKSLVGYVKENPIEIFRETMELNFFGTINTVNAVLPSMLERRKGCICFITSAAALTSYIGLSAYSPTKYAHGSVGFEFENLTKPAECKALEATEKLFQPEEVATSILKDLKNGVYNMYCGDFGIALLGVLSGGMSPRKNTALDMLLFPFAVVVAFVVRRGWDLHVKRGYVHPDSKFV